MFKNGLNRIQYLGGCIGVIGVTFVGEVVAIPMGADPVAVYYWAFALIAASWIALVGMRFHNMGRSWAWGLTALVPALVSIPVLIWGFFGKPQRGIA